MKARQTFSILVGEKGNHVYEDGKEVTFNAGDQIPDKLVPHLLVHNKAFLDVDFVEGVVQLTDAERKKYGILADAEAKVKQKKLTAAEAKGLNKDEQLELIKKLGSEEKPRYEKDRVKLILELQNA